MASECWLWAGAITPQGYGQLKRNLLAHRVVYEALVGEIPKGLQIDHLCRNRLCVNPKHLEPVTQRENILRGQGVSALNAKKTHCPAGHEYTGKNVSFRPNGDRRCLPCHSKQEIKRRRRIKLSLVK